MISQQEQRKMSVLDYNNAQKMKSSFLVTKA